MSPELKEALLEIQDGLFSAQVGAEMWESEVGDDESPIELWLSDLQEATSTLLDRAIELGIGGLEEDDK